MSGTLCLTSRTTTTDQSHEEEEDSDVFALRDTYTKRLLLLTMMTEQQTCMDAIVDQNFSECLDPSSSSPPGSSEMMMMPAAMGGGIETASAESSCTSSTPFEEWVRTNLSAKKVVRALALSGCYNPRTKSFESNICWFQAYLEGLFNMTDKFGEFDVNSTYEKVALHKVEEQCALAGWNFERVCQVACDEEIEFEPFTGLEAYDSSTSEEESLPVCYKTIITTPTPRTPPGFYREIHNNTRAFPVGRKQQRRKKKGPRQQPKRKSRNKGVKRVPLEASKPTTIVVERPGKRPCTKLALK